MKTSFSARLITATAFCFAMLFDPSSSHAVGCSFTILNSDPNYNLVNLSCHKTQQDALSACESYALGTCQQLTVPEGSAIAQQGAPVGSTCYQSYGNGHPQPYALFFYGDEGNLDTDGDGIPDDEDPCPDNPDPECSNPDEPPPTDPPDGPEIPDEVEVGDCKFDLRGFKEWINTESAFPFNFIWKIVSIFTPLAELDPDPPVINSSIDFSAANAKWSYLPTNLQINWDFTQYNNYAVFLRTVQTLVLGAVVAVYALQSFRNRT